MEATFAGVGRHVLDLVEGQVAAGHTVDVAYGARRADDAFLSRLATSGVRRTVALDIGREPGIADVGAHVTLRRFVRGERYDLVHGHASKGGVHARLLPRRAARFVYTPNALVTMDPTLTGPQRRVFVGIERRLSRRTDLLIHVSPEEQEHATTIGLRPRCAVVVPNGIPFPDLPDRATVRAELGLPDDVVVVGFVGRLSSQKGVDRLVEAVAEVEATSPWVVAVVGEGDDTDLRQQAERLGVGERVRWLGRRPGQRAMAAFDLLVVPSRYEGFPYVVLEGLWAGLPVVATAGACASQVLDGGTVGVLVGPDPASLGRAIGSLVDDAAARTAMTAAARSAADSFGVEVMVERTVGMYRGALDGRGPRDGRVTTGPPGSGRDR